MSSAIPRGVLIGVAALLVLTAAFAAFVRLTGSTERAVIPAGSIVSERELRFEDLADGGLAVIDADSRQTIEVVPARTNGFLRATLRGLVRERRRSGLGPEQPFSLARLSDGQIVLSDPATGRTVFLAAFGQTNAEAFASFLPASPPATR